MPEAELPRPGLVTLPDHVVRSFWAYRKVERSPLKERNQLYEVGIKT